MNRTWIGLANSKLQTIEPPVSAQDYTSIVQNEAIAVHQCLDKHLSFILDKLEIQIDLKEGDSSERLARGINELGLIKPDFGKPFKNLFYDRIQVSLKFKKINKESKSEFVERYVTGLIIQYFMDHPSEYSNWEFNERNRKAAMHPLMTARKVNFPNIVINLE